MEDQAPYFIAPPKTIFRHLYEYLQALSNVREISERIRLKNLEGQISKPGIDPMSEEDLLAAKARFVDVFSLKEKELMESVRKETVSPFPKTSPEGVVIHEINLILDPNFQFPWAYPDRVSITVIGDQMTVTELF